MRAERMDRQKTGQMIGHGMMTLMMSPDGVNVLVQSMIGHGMMMDSWQSWNEGELGAQQSVAALVTDPSPEIISSSVSQNDLGSGSMTTGQRVRTVRGAKPGLSTNFFVGACLLVATLGARTVVPDELPTLANAQTGAAKDTDIVG